MTSKSHAARRFERLIVRSILAHPSDTISPSIRRALDYAPFWWDEVTVSSGARAIRQCLWNNILPTLPNVRYQMVNNGCDGTMVGLVELLCVTQRPWELKDMDRAKVAEWLVNRYQGKMLAERLGHLWQRMRRQPEKAKDMMKELSK